MSSVEFGWFISPNGTEGTGRVPLAVWQQREVLPEVAMYFDSLWVSDHLLAFGDASMPFLECWTTLTWLAARYPNLRMGTIVMAVGFRHPALLAKMAASLQLLSEGRFVMGIGGGWREAEYKAYGYEFPKASVRIAQLEEAVRIMKMMWTEKAPSFEGKYFRIEEAYCYPHPEPGIPVMIGGSGEQLLVPLAARYGDIWDVYHGGSHDTFDLEKYGRKVEILRRVEEEAGREPGEIKQSVTIGEARLPNSSEESKAWMESLRAMMGLGVKQFIVDCGEVTSGELVERFGEEVVRRVGGR